MNTTDNATLSGASDQDDNDEKEVKQQVQSARELAIEAIAEQRRQSLEDDGVTIEKEQQQETQLAAQLAQDEKPVMAGETMRVKVKVDGEEIELPLSEVVKSYQKDAAATKRLQEASSILAMAKEKASSIAQNNTQEFTNENLDNDSDENKEQCRVKIKDAFSKLYEGDEEGAADAMLEIVSSGAKATKDRAIDPAVIAAQVRQQLEIESVYSETRSDYPELFSDTERGIVLGRETVARMNIKESTGIPRSQAMQEAAREVAEMFGIQKSGRQQDQVKRTARDTKLARKATLDNPESANVVSGNTVSPAEVQNVSSVIAEMARGRLGQSLGSR